MNEPDLKDFLRVGMDNETYEQFKARMAQGEE